MGYKANFISSLDEKTIIKIHNKYCSSDETIYENNEKNFNFLCGNDASPWEVINNLTNVDCYDIHDDYIKDTIYGIESNDDPVDEWVDISKLERADLTSFVDEDDAIDYLADEEMLLNEKQKEAFIEWLADEGYDLRYDDDWEDIEDKFNESQEEEESEE